MGFRSDAQLAHVCRALCHRVGLAQLWTVEGPTPQAIALLHADGGHLSGGERIMLMAAWAFWNSAPNISLADVAHTIDAKSTIAVASLMLAAAHGPAAIDHWLATIDTPIPR
jgi:ABC-type transport system involved in cytochrome bd biosynthesis fused ATPase/permease subunit